MNNVDIITINAKYITDIQIRDRYKNTVTVRINLIYGQPEKDYDCIDFSFDSYENAKKFYKWVVNEFKTKDIIELSNDEIYEKFDK